ncbi:uncharacterized protein [Drosophila bipectinata]|uniref:uncharacterized protein n=1 Tax=Drosophila bipectinata TaxID=42026 RepID=UPI001C89757C|nr:uncharacterized protein LOC108126163 [Drosophila bipectinata]XP_017098102.2 uncharacterized protein LOC108126163 [Drosophila bipectinata]XP_017098105.2 uncharacterized protein LOC108126163 [Drosophila bipectinata]
MILINVIIVQNKMIEIRRRVNKTSNALESNDELALDYCQRLQGSTHRATDKTSGPGVCLRYQPVATVFLLLLLCLAPVLGAPQTSCIRCDKEDFRTRAPHHGEEFVERIVDHQVSKFQAREALRKLNETHRQNNACSSINCTATIENYCFGHQFLNDHCWCEMQHREEGLPYVNHICYADEKVHKPSIGSCFVFAEVKECCCAKAFYNKWRANSGSKNIPKILIPWLIAFSLVHWLSRRRWFC